MGRIEPISLISPIRTSPAWDGFTERVGRSQGWLRGRGRRRRTSTIGGCAPEKIRPAGDCGSLNLDCSSQPEYRLRSSAGASARRWRSLLMMMGGSMMLLSRSRSAGRRSWRRIGCKCCHAEAEHRREQKNNFVHDFDKQLLRFSHVCFFLRSLEKSGVAPNQPIRVTCGRQKPTFGRSRLCRSRSRSQRLRHSPLPDEFGVALTHVTSHDETQETHGSFEINFKRSSRGSRSPRSSRREFHDFKGARRHVWHRGKVARPSCILAPGHSLRSLNSLDSSYSSNSFFFATLRARDLSGT
jgi:hypothetical protein